VKLVLATRNAHKVRELAALLDGYDVVPLPDDIDLPPETGETFAANALPKARAAAAATGEVAFGDDSGIESAALGGAPGVRSARFAGEQATDAENLAALLQALEAVDDRRVAYVAELVMISPDGRELYARGELRGTLAKEPRGSGGFGYDPAFVPEGEERTVGEMSAEEKDAVSHRARAAAALRELLPS
jgi:XTP/dITP diphosphohydrolase